MTSVVADAIVALSNMHKPFLSGQDQEHGWNQAVCISQVFMWSQQDRLKVVRERKWREEVGLCCTCQHWPHSCVQHTRLREQWECLGVDKKSTNATSIMGGVWRGTYKHKRTPNSVCRSLKFLLWLISSSGHYLVIHFDFIVTCPPTLRVGVLATRCTQNASSPPEIWSKPFLVVISCNCRGGLRWTTAW